MGRGCRRGVRRDPPGKISNHPGISLRALRGVGDPHSAVSSGGTAAARVARIFPARRSGGRGMSTPLLACNGVTCRCDGEIIGLIGPNGSGKTTLFNVVTGLYDPDAGKVSFAGADITAASPQAVYRAGITRTLQRSRMCLPLSVFDNIMIGNHKRLNHGLAFNVLRRRAFAEECRRNWEEARELVSI